MGGFDYLFKVLVVGDSTVGKTSLLNRYVHDVFGKDYKATMGGEWHSCVTALLYWHCYLSAHSSTPPHSGCFSPCFTLSYPFLLFTLLGKDPYAD